MDPSRVFRPSWVDEIREMEEFVGPLQPTHHFEEPNAEENNAREPVPSLYHTSEDTSYPAEPEFDPYETSPEFVRYSPMPVDEEVLRDMAVHDLRGLGGFDELTDEILDDLDEKFDNEYRRSDQYGRSPDSGSSAQELDSLLLSSGQTLITQPDNDNRAGDLDHILDATAYYEKLDMLESDTAEMCGIRQGPRTQIGSPSECLEILQKCLHALHNLQREGFCGDSLSILVEDHRRPGVAKAVQISLLEVGYLVSELEEFLVSGECTGLVFSDMLQNLGVFSRSLVSSQDWQAACQFLSIVLPLGLVSFSGSHVCRFDINLWGVAMEKIHVDHEYSFGLRQLACLKDFVGGPVWVLGKNEPQPEQAGFKVSLRVQDLQELWGPVWWVEGCTSAGPMLRTESGFIVPLPKGEQSDPPFRTEIECHWTEEIPDYYTRENHIWMNKTSRILIGTESINRVGLASNPSCKSQICQIEERICNQIQFTGTCNEYYTREGHDIQLTGGQYVNIGAIIKYKRNPARTMKQSIIAACHRPETDIEALLRLNIGLEISACTGNARRVRLWDALHLSKTAGLCGNHVADPKCFQSCWRSSAVRPNSQVETLSIVPTADQIRSTLINSILALEGTGLDQEGNLQAHWPFIAGNWNRRIASTPHNKWFDVIADSRDTATFAVVSQNCLIFQDACAGPTECPQSFLDEDQKTCLSIRILRPVSSRDRGSRRRLFGLSSPSPECDLGDLPPETVFRVGKRYLTVKKAWEGRHRAMVATTNASLRLGAPDFREQVNPDIKGGEPIEVIICSKSFGA